MIGSAVFRAEEISRFFPCTCSRGICWLGSSRIHGKIPAAMQPAGTFVVSACAHRCIHVIYSLCGIPLMGTLRSSLHVYVLNLFLEEIRPAQLNFGSLRQCGSRDTAVEILGISSVLLDKYSG